MRRLHIVVILLLVGAVTASAAEAQGDATPEAVVAAFYSTYQTMPHSGIPDVSDQAKLDPMLSRPLRRLLHKAQRHENEAATQHPDEAPAFEGDLFSSNFESFTTFRVGEVTKRGERFRVEVELTYSEPGLSDEPARWNDTVYVVREKGKLVIDEFEFLANWPFGNHGRLSDALRKSLSY